MKKIVALVDAVHFKEEQLDVFQYFARVLNGKLVINGSFPSMFAIKQFTQLFAAFTERKVTVIYVSEKNTTGIPFEKLLKEYMNMYYDSIDFKTLEGEPDKVIGELLHNRKDCIITFGAYGRSNLSRFCKRSNVDNILRKLEIPVFITHP